MTSLLLDIRFALRSLRRRPTFAIVAIATIALSIGAATSIFSVVDGVVFRPLAFADPSRLVAIWQTYPEWKKEPILAPSWDRISLNPVEYREWRAAQTVFEDIGIWTTQSYTLAGAESPELVAATRASSSLLPVLGLKPVLGRGFLPGEDVFGGPHVTMLSYENWQARYGGRRDILGQTVGFDGVPYTIVGVLPRGLTLGRNNAANPFWIPAGQDPDDLNRGNHSYAAIGRLKPGISLARATAESERILRGDIPPEKRGARVADLQHEQTREVRAPMLLLLGAVGLLLLVACVNVATLLLGEAAAREHEMAARVALGANRARIVRQLLTESLVLSATGGVFGALLAFWGTKALVALAPPRIPGIQQVHVDARVLLFALAAAATTGILFGLAPALTLSRSGPAALMRTGAGQSAAGRGLMQRMMIAAELALSVVLLVSAGLLSRSLEKLTRVDPGFRPDNLLTVRVSLPRLQYSDSTARRAFYRDAAERLAALPGVAAVTASSASPFTNSNSSSSFEVVGRPKRPDEPNREAQQRVVMPGFFETLGIPLIAGRAFTAEDRTGAPLVAVISESAARRDWPDESAIGKVVKYQRGLWTIVGIVGDIKYRRLSMNDEATIYTPLAQRQQGLNLLVRTRNDPAPVIPDIRRALHDVAPTAPITGVDVMTQQIRQSFADERYRTLLISLFGVMAAVLAAVGMYGVTARAVHRRTREMGIRVALGATTGSVVRLVVRYTLGGVAIGVIIGMLGSLGASRVLTPYLFGVTAMDPVTYVGIFAFLAAVSVVASWIPARRAGRVQPAMVLRGE